MANSQPTPPPPPSFAPAPLETSPVTQRRFRDYLSDWFTIRKEIAVWQAAFWALACVAVCFGVWWYVTLGEPEERILSPVKLPSPAETFAELRTLVVDRKLDVNTLVTLKRVALGFGLAVLVGVPLGILAGCFPRINAFLLPVKVFGCNIPIAALIFIMYSLFGIGELQKVMFIFIACVAFIVSDTARSINDVGGQYIDTAYTLGASRWQVIMKVLVPLALPSVFNSLRLLFGLAFGYIMLAETIKIGSEAGGLGDIIITSQKRGIREHIILVLLIIPLIALAVDRVLFWIQQELFPHRYGGAGMLNRCVRFVMHAFEDVKHLIVKPTPLPGGVTVPKK